MSATTSLVVITSAQSATAAIAAQEAARKACMSLVRGYEHDKANAKEMKAYAECVSTLHPQQLTGDALIAWKVAVLVILVSVVGGVFVERRNQYLSDGWFGAIVTGVLTGLLSGVGIVVLGAFLIFSVRVLSA